MQERYASIGEWRKNGSGPERSAAVELTQEKAQNLKHGRLPDLDPETQSFRYDSKQHFGDLTVFVRCKPYSKLPPALRDDSFKCRTSSLVALLWYTFIWDEYQAVVCPIFENVKVLREFFRFAGQMSTQKSVCWKAGMILISALRLR